MKKVLELTIIAVLSFTAVSAQAKKRPKRDEVGQSVMLMFSPWSLTTMWVSDASEDSSDSTSSANKDYAQADQMQIVAGVRPEATVVLAKTQTIPEIGESTQIEVSTNLIRSIGIVKTAAENQGMKDVTNDLALLAIVRGCVPTNQGCMGLPVLE